MQLLSLAILLVAQSFAQADFEKLRQEYVSRKTLLDSMYSYPDVRFDSIKVMNSEGIPISFWWMSGAKGKGQKAKGKGTILLVHGFMMNKSHMLARAKIYYNLGFNVIVMDLRARGQSGGATTTSGPEIRSDVIAVMDYYENKLKDYGPLILAGYSHGGRAVVFAAEKKPANVIAIILESIPYSLSASFKRTYKMDPPPIPEGNIAVAFQTISNIPILLMTGENDTAIIPDEASAIKGSNKNRLSQFVSIKGAGHDLSGEKYREVYVESIKSFLASF